MSENKPVSESVFKSCKGAETWVRVELPTPPEMGVFIREYQSAIEFCQNECVGHHFKLLRDFWFEDPAEAVMFKLRFG